MEYMSNLVEYEFHNGEFSTTVDRQKKIIVMNERGGWGRTYTISFKDLLKASKQWQVIVDLNESDRVLAEIGTNIMLANNAVMHGLAPFRYVPKTADVTNPSDLEIIKQFEKLFNRYDAANIISVMNQKTKDKLKI